MNKNYLGKISNGVLLILSLSGCLGVDKSDFIKKAEELSISPTDTEIGISGFEGISSIDEVTGTMARANWTLHAEATSYAVYNFTSGITYQVVHGLKSSHVIKGLSNGTTYRVGVRSISSSGDLDSNSKYIEFTTDPAPDAPSALTLVSPATVRSFEKYPTFNVAGVNIGDTVSIYTDEDCTLGRRVATGVATAFSIDLTTTVLPPGTHTFYANVVNANNEPSACSTVNLEYKVEACPSGFVPAKQDIALGVSSFCVMQFEAKNDGGVAASHPAGLPWVSIDQPDAKQACTALGTNYDLISNPEWMAIARDIEGEKRNWSSSTVGLGMLPRGHSDGTPAALLNVTTTFDSYNGTGNTPFEAVGSGWEQKRTHRLSNNEVLWDFSGNAWEHVDWTLGGLLSIGPTTCLAAYTEIPLVACADLDDDDYLPSNPAAVPTLTYDSNFGLGQIYGGVGGAAIRGGTYNFPITSGIYGLYLFNAPAVSTVQISFRCVYRL
jgi:hypothetical protein